MVKTQYVDRVAELIDEDLVVLFYRDILKLWRDGLSPEEAATEIETLDFELSEAHQFDYSEHFA